MDLGVKDGTHGTRLGEDKMTSSLVNDYEKRDRPARTCVVDSI